MSRFIDHLEKRFGNWAIPGLIKYLAILCMGTYLLSAIRPELITRLDFDLFKIQQGEFWRIFSFILAPSATAFTKSGAVCMFFATYLLFIFSDGLEESWGVFRTNLYVLAGFLFSLLSITLFTTNFGYSPTLLGGTLLALTIFLAFATNHPHFTINLMFILPCPVWIIGLVSGLALVRSAVIHPAMAPYITLSIANYILVAVPLLINKSKTSHSSRKRRNNFRALTSKNSGTPFHTCHHCGANDISNPDLEYRVSSKDGNTYCTNHLPK